MLAVGAGDAVHIFHVAAAIASLEDEDGVAEPTVLPKLHTLAIHVKAISALAFSPVHQTLLTAANDGRIKFVSLAIGDEFQVQATKKVDGAVTAVAITDEGSEFSWGTIAGTLCSMAFPSSAAAASTSRAAAASARERRILIDRLARVRKLLAVFQYHRALRSALYSRLPAVVINCLEELLRRSALHVALSGHNDRSIVQLLRVAMQHIDVPQLTNVCMTTIDFIIAIYGPMAVKSEFFHKELLRAHTRLGEISRCLDNIQRCAAQLELIVDQ